MKAVEVRTEQRDILVFTVPSGDQYHMPLQGLDAATREWFASLQPAESTETRRKDNAEAVELQQLLLGAFRAYRPADSGLMGWARSALLNVGAALDRQSAAVDRMLQEAQIHACEARAANATLHEIYQICSDAKGEPGTWHGAEPVLQMRARLQRAEQALRDIASETYDGEKAQRLALNVLGVGNAR